VLAVTVCFEISIFWLTSSFFSPTGCTATLVCWVTFGRVQVLDGICLAPSHVVSGLDMSMKLTTGPTTGVGSRPGLSAVVWWAAARLYMSSRLVASSEPSDAFQ
jgi:hypothetical protein